MTKLLTVLLLPILLIVAAISFAGWAFGSQESIEVRKTRLHRLLHPLGLAVMATMLAALLAYIPLAGYTFDNGVLTRRYPDHQRHRSTDASGAAQGRTHHQTQPRDEPSPEAASA